MVTFDQVIADGIMLVISPGCKSENTGFFTRARVDRNTVPIQWHTYELRKGAKGLASLEPQVTSDFAGTFLSRKEIKFKNKECFHCLHRGAGYRFS